MNTTKAIEQWKCDIFNHAFKPGDELIFKDDFGQTHIAKLKWKAFVMGSEAVARAEGWDAYLLERFSPLCTHAWKQESGALPGSVYKCTKCGKEETEY